MPRKCPIEKIRNIGIIAHIDAGKTTVTERILFYTGRKHKIGEVHYGEAEMDWMDQEKERGITITSAATTCFWPPAKATEDRLPAETHQINIIDTPGHIDFTVEVQRSLRVLDGGILVFDGVAGVEPQSETVFHQAEKFKVPLIAFVNKLDRTGADFYYDLQSIRERLHKNAHPIQLPIGESETFQGIVDLFEEKAIIYKDDLGKEREIQEIPDAMREQVQEYRSKLIEAIVENDDQLMDKYLQGEDISVAELKKALRQAVIGGKMIPVLCGSALKNKGIQLLLDAIVEYLPSPTDIPPVEGCHPKDEEKKEVRYARDDEPLAGLAFKIASDPYVGKLCFFRVYSGVIRSGSYVLNTNTGEKERVGRILRMHANHREEVHEVYAGEIAALVGLKKTATGHTLCDPDHPIVLESITFPQPVISLAIEPKTKQDQEKMGLALQKLSEEDPTLVVSTNEDTLQTILSGMGELHLEIIVDRLKREFGVEANVGKPQVAYRETITKSAQAEGKYIRQSGGRGQYGHCWLRVEPLEEGMGFEFIDEIKGGIIPKEYIPAIEKGVKEAMDKGILAGYPMVDVKCTVYDGSFHEVDSSEAAFKIAGSIAFQEAAKQANPILLEPLMKFEVIVPEQYMGDVIGSLNAKRAKIAEMKDRGQMKVIHGEVPLAEMFGYATELRSLTQGRASYSMEFLRYTPVPQNVAEIIRGEREGEKVKR